MPWSSAPKRCTCAQASTPSPGVVCPGSAGQLTRNYTAPSLSVRCERGNRSSYPAIQLGLEGFAGPPFGLRPQLLVGFRGCDRAPWRTAVITDVRHLLQLAQPVRLQPHRAGASCFWASLRVVPDSRAGRRACLSPWLACVQCGTSRQSWAWPRRSGECSAEIAYFKSR